MKKVGFLLRVSRRVLTSHFIDDRHIPTLTVSQTLDFVLSTKTPGKTGRLPHLTSAQFRLEVKSTLLRMLNMAHTEQTLVGDEFIRGVSGGERKRVSIAEMMATRARVQCWDNSTRGLDASTALDFVKSLRVMTDVLGQTTFVTLYGFLICLVHIQHSLIPTLRYQAGENLYNLFDKVLVLDEGRQVYFGPPSEARAYFENIGYKKLPRESTPDYLTGCTDPNERHFAPGRSQADVPSTPASLEKTFRQSPPMKRLLTELEDSKVHMAKTVQNQEMLAYVSSPASSLI